MENKNIGANGNIKGNDNPKMKQEKLSLGKRAIQTYDRFRTSKIGRWVLRGVKVVTTIAAGCGIYEMGFKKGKESVEPVVIYKDKEPEAQENPEEESTETETENTEA